jgi:hypothetical protein
MAIALNPSAFNSGLSKLRTDVDSELLKDAPAVVTFRVGSDEFKVTTRDLVLETETRFSRCLDTVIHIEPADAPAASMAFDMIRMNAPDTMTLQEIVETIATLSYLNAWTCIACMADYLKGADLPTNAMLQILETSIRFTQSSALTASLATVPVLREDITAFWDSIAPYANRDMCLGFAYGCGTTLNRFAWWTAAALSCDASCADLDKLVPSEMAELADCVSMDFMSRCKIWCGCRSRVVASKKYLNTDEAFVVSQTYDAFVIACKVTPVMMNNSDSTVSPAVDVKIGKDTYAAKIITKRKLPTIWGAFLEVTPLPPKLYLEFGYSSFVHEVLREDAFASIPEADVKRCRSRMEPTVTDWGFSNFRPQSAEAGYVVVRASLSTDE